MKFVVLSVGGWGYWRMQLCMQKVLAMAVRTVMMKLMMVLMFSFFIVVVGFDGYTIGGEGLWRL